MKSKWNHRESGEYTEVVESLAIEFQCSVYSASTLFSLRLNMIARSNYNLIK